MAVRPQRRLITVDEYEHMIAAGVFRPDDRLELIRGEIVEMAPIGSAHAGRVNALNSLLMSRLGDRMVLAPQNPVRVGRHSEPQPDLALLRPRADSYEASNPEVADVLLLIEVADTTLTVDRRVKVPLYAAEGIPEVWIVDLAARRVEIFRNPSGDAYRQTSVAEGDQSIAPIAFPDVRFTAREITGPAPAE